VRTLAIQSLAGCAARSPAVGVEPPPQVTATAVTASTQESSSHEEMIDDEAGIYGLAVLV
jgi:hypothetical protein